MPSHVPAPPTSLPPSALSDVLAQDEELLALPAPRRYERTATLVLLVVNALASLLLLVSLRGELSYALSSTIPIELRELRTSVPGPDMANHYVRGDGLLASSQSLRYDRLLEGDSFRLAPLAGNTKLWVEIRVPEGMESPRFIPPVSFIGRLVPFANAGVRYVGLRQSVRQAGLGPVPEDAWLLIDGASPRASRWSIALALLLTYFLAWNVLTAIRIVRPSER